MESNIGSLMEIIENNEKLIEYIKQTYKEKTGEDIAVQDLKSLAEKQLKEEEAKELISNQKFLTFNDKVIALNLPDINDREACSRIEKLRKHNDTKVLIKKVDISHFANKGMTIELLYKVLDGLKVLQSVEEVNLSHNNLTDDYIDIISEYLMLNGLIKIDLSFNKLTKNSVKKLVTTLKLCKNYEKIDVSYNPFNLDERSCINICAALKDCNKIIHFGINDSSRESAIRFVNTHPTLKSLNLEDSRYKKKVWVSLARMIGRSNTYEFNNLSLKFCKIDFLYATPPIVRALKNNYTLINLNLYNTGLDDFSGTQIINALSKHRKLEELNLGANFLAKHFCKSFGKVLTINNNLRVVNISKNYNITKDDYYYILEGLTSNQSILSFGDLSDMKIGVKYRVSTEELLSLNKGFNDWKNVKGVKVEKANFYTSNIYSEYVKQEKIRENELISNSNKKFMKTDNNIFLESQNMSNNLFNSNSSMNLNNSTSANKNKSATKNKNKNKKDNKPIDKKEQRRIVNEKVMKSLYNVPNSNFIDKLSEKLPVGNKNRFYEEPIKNENCYTNDVNKIIKNFEEIQQINSFQNSDLNKLNFDKSGKFIVPYSMPNKHILQDLKKYEQDKNKGKSKKTLKTSPMNLRYRSANKIRKKVVKNKPSLLNIIACLTQEIINNDKDLKEAIGIFYENFVNTDIEKNDSDKYDRGEGLSYGKINLEEMIDNTENKGDFIAKYNLIENNFDEEFQELEPYYL